MAGTASDADSVSAGIVALIVFQLFATVGAVIAARRPENPIGWLFLAVPLLTSLANASSGYTSSRRSAGWAAPSPSPWPSGGPGSPPSGVTAVIILLFPDGRLPSARWRPIAVFRGRMADRRRRLVHVRWPARSMSRSSTSTTRSVCRGFGFVVDVLGLIGLVVLLVAAVTSLVLRFLRNREQRQQIKWFLASVGVALLVILPLNIADAVSTSFDGPPDAVFLLALGTIPLATGLAILKYRLYEIDRIVNRAVVYAAVTALLVGAYFGIVLGLQEVFASFGGGSDLAIADLDARRRRPLPPPAGPSAARRRPALLPPPLRRPAHPRGLLRTAARRDRHRRRSTASSPPSWGERSSPSGSRSGSRARRCNDEPARTASRAAWAACAICVALMFTALAFLVLNRSTPGVSNFGSRIGDAAYGIALLAFPTVGALVASRRPENPIGWILTGVGILFGFAAFANEYAVYALLTEPGSLPAGETMAWVGSWLFLAPLILSGTLLFLLFPDGRLLSRRWRVVAVDRHGRTRAGAARGDVRA